MGRVGATGDDAVRGGRFAAPRPADCLALRPMVLERLSAPDSRVGVITAPAGYGKTSHAAAWVAGDGRPVAWIDLEAEHDDALVLLTDLVAALTAVTDFDGDALPVGGATADQYATGVAAALARAVRACTVPFMLVLDDVHRLSDLSATDLVGSLVSNVPPGSMVLLVGRACLLGGSMRACPEEQQQHRPHDHNTDQNKIGDTHEDQQASRLPLETIADPAYRHNARRHGRIGLDLLSQPSHVDINGATIAVVVESPHAREQ